MSDKIKAGRLFFFTMGAYSDYHLTGHFLALQDIDATLFKTCEERCIARIKAGEGRAYGGPVDPDDESDVRYALRDMFLPELIRMGAVMDIEATEVHLGEVFDFKPEIRSA